KPPRHEGATEGLQMQALRAARVLSWTSADRGSRSAFELVVPDEWTEIRPVLRESAVVVHSRATRNVPEDDRALVAARDRAPVGIEVPRPGRRPGAAAYVRPARRLAERNGGLEERLRVLLSVRGGRGLDEASGRRRRRRGARRPVLPVGRRVEVDVVVQEV